jgi:transcriptional regulator with XRE-family HTH domain
MGNLGNKEIMAKNIRHYMEKYNKTRQDMCDALGVKYTTFTDWVKGNSYPRIDKIELMANYFGISKADLVEDRSDDSSLTAHDERDIAKDLDRIMGEIQKGDDGPLYYNGVEIDNASLSLLENAIEYALRETKKENKVKYNPNKNKK